MIQFACGQPTLTVSYQAAMGYLIAVIGLLIEPYTPTKGLPDDAEREYRRLIKVRKGGEDFAQVIREVKDLLSRKPDLPRGREMLQLFEEEQRKLEAEGKSAGVPASS